MVTARIQSGTGVSVPRAAELLQVSVKTVRNYLSKGILSAEMWNGSWRIDVDSIRRTYWNKFGNPMEADAEPETQTSLSDGVTLGLADYRKLLEQVSRAAALEVNVSDLERQRDRLQERVLQLEASAASGWTESRQRKEQVERITNQLATRNEEYEGLRETLQAMRRERDDSERALEAERRLSEGFRAELRDFRMIATEQEKELGGLRNTLSDLRARFLTQNPRVGKIRSGSIGSFLARE